ncbi:hypothetical protein B0H15DRAFT_150694 [Mycena belliarum]|uniref:Uncharacterized protein n=1 Tax=Mycena belliarum TaxID=1033014 RepID=A0AAD6U7Q0_9AGAR|nr:hypothetical protein B0H15DRAFT_150694 [Mycena belliae]
MKISDTVLLEGCLTFVVCSHWERSLLYPSWAFPLGDSEHTDVARYLDFSSRSPRIPLSTQRRLQLGLCVGVVALGEGFLGIPSDALQSSGQYRAVWYDPTDEYPGPKDDRHVVTAAQLAQPLSEHPSFPSKCILIIPTNQQDLRQPQEAIVKTLAEEWAKRTNVSRGVETSCLKVCHIASREDILIFPVLAGRSKYSWREMCTNTHNIRHGVCPYPRACSRHRHLQSRHSIVDESYCDIHGLVLRSVRVRRQQASRRILVQRRSHNQ